MTLPVSTDWLRAAAAVSPARPAVAVEDLVLSYAELDDLVDRTATGLLRHGAVGPGVRVGIGARRGLDTVALLWATWRVGATAAVLDPEAPELFSGSEALCRRWGLVDVFSAVVPGDDAPAALVVRPDAGSPHTLVPTSGSGGEPKLVVLTHANVAAAVAASRDRLENRASDRWLLVLPLFHVGGLSILWRSAAARGCVVLHERFDPGRVAEAIEAGEITMASLVPTMLVRLLDTGARGVGTMRTILVGGAATDDALVWRALQAGLPVLTTYGLTEAASQVATVVPGTMAQAVGTCGPPLRNMQVTIAAPGPDGVGTITIDGPAVSPGYVDEPLRRGPLTTGDLGRWDAAGRLVVVGRGDEVIVTGGEKVAPATVERVLAAHPAVAAAAVIGRPDPEWGARVVAVVVPAGEVTAEALAAYTADRLSPAQRPKEYRFVPTLPLLANGKVDRRAVRDGVGGA